MVFTVRNDIDEGAQLQSGLCYELFEARLIYTQAKIRHGIKID